MNAHTSLPRRTFEELRDFRSDEQKVRDAVDGALGGDEDDQAFLFRFIEDQFCVNPRKLAEALLA